MTQLVSGGRTKNEVDAGQLKAIDLANATQQTAEEIGQSLDSAKAIALKKPAGTEPSVAAIISAVNDGTYAVGSIVDSSAYVAGERIGGKRYVVEESDPRPSGNSGEIIYCAGNKYIRGLDFSGGVNVAWFGAIPDTDSTTQVQAASNYCFNNSIRYLDFPEGNFKINNVDFHGVKVRGAGRQVTKLSPVDDNADYVARISRARGDFEDITLEHDRSFDCHGIVYEHEDGALAGTAVNRYAYPKDLEVYGFRGAGIYCANAMIESDFGNTRIEQCGDPAREFASFHIRNPSTNNEWTNNISLGNLLVIFPYWKGVSIESEKGEAGESAPGIRILKLPNIFIHGHTEAIDSAPAPYTMLHIKNFTGLEIGYINLARCPNAVDAVILERGDNNRARRVNIGNINANGVGGGQNANLLSLIGVQDANLGVLTPGQDFQNGMDLRLDSDCARIDLPKWIMASDRTPNISDASISSFGSDNQDYTFKNQSLRGVAGFNGSRNISGRVSITDPATSAVVVFENTEPDTLYRIPSLVTNKTGVVASYAEITTTGFKINIQRNGNTNTVNVDWMIIR